MKKRNNPEDDLQKMVWQYIKLRYPHVLAFHVPNGGRRNIREAARFKSMGVLPGVSDFLLFWIDGRGAIELKAGKNKMSDHQKAFADKWSQYGGSFALCYSFDEVKKILEDWLGF